MNLKQSILGNFFKNKKGSDSDLDSGSDNGSVYLPSKSKRMYDRPMSWTRVRHVIHSNNQRMTIYDVE